MTVTETTDMPARRRSAHTMKEELLLVLLFLGALSVRIIAMLYFHTYEFPTEKSRVGAEMGWIAWNLANGEGFKLGDRYTAWMAPLFPFILSLIFRLFDYEARSSTIAILAAQSFASSLVVLPIYFIAKRLFSQMEGLITSLLWVFHPASLYFAIRFIWSSSFTSLGLTLITLLFLRLCDRPARKLDALLCGLIIGLTALSNPVIIAFVPFAALWLLWRNKKTPIEAIGQLTVIAIVTIGVLTPWTIRNHSIFREFVPVKGTLGVNLWLGNYGLDIDQATAGLGFWNRIKEVYSEEEVTYLSGLNEVERDKVLRNRAIEFIVANPGTFAKYIIHRIYLFWRLTVFTYTSGSLGILLDRMLLSLIPLAGLGLIASWQRWRDTVLLLLLFASFPMIYYLTHAGYPRFRLPIEGPMLVFVAYAIGYFLRLARLEPGILAAKHAEMDVR